MKRAWITCLVLGLLATQVGLYRLTTTAGMMQRTIGTLLKRQAEHEHRLRQAQIEISVLRAQLQQGEELILIEDMPRGEI